MKNSLTFKAWHQPILPQVACGFGLGTFCKSRQGSNITQCRNQTTRSFPGWFCSPGEPVHPVGGTGCTALCYSPLQVYDDWHGGGAVKTPPAQPKGAFSLLDGDLRPGRTSRASSSEEVPPSLELHPDLDP